MKKLLLSSVLALASVATQAAEIHECKIRSVRDDKTGAKFKANGGWQMSDREFDDLCSKLSRAHARIQINAASAVLSQKSIGWAILTVLDLDTDIGTSDFASFSTQVHDYASQDKADELMVVAINEAAKGWKSLDEALAKLDVARRKVRALGTHGQK